METKTRPWWRKKRWWILLIVATCAPSLQFHFAQRRAYAVEQLRAEMRNRAVNGPGVEPPPPCVTVVNTGEVLCDKQRVLLACETRIFLDPFDLWSGTSGHDDLENLVNDKFNDDRDMAKLAQWFACQGFKVSHENGAINANVSTPNGYGIFNAGTFPWPPAWSEGFSTGGRLQRDGKLSMDIGTTYE